MANVYVEVIFSPRASFSCPLTESFSLPQKHLCHWILFFDQVFRHLSELAYSVLIEVALRKH